MRVAAVAGYVALYIAVIGLSLPGGAIMTVTGGFLFGPVDRHHRGARWARSPAPPSSS